MLPPLCQRRAGRGGAQARHWGALAHKDHGASGSWKQSWRQLSCIVVALAIAVLGPCGCCGPVGPDPPRLPSPQTPARLRLHAIASPPTRLFDCWVLPPPVHCNVNFFRLLYPPHTSPSNPPLLFLSPEMQSKKIENEWYQKTTTVSKINQILPFQQTNLLPINYRRCECPWLGLNSSKTGYNHQYINADASIKITDQAPCHLVLTTCPPWRIPPNQVQGASPTSHRWDMHPWFGRRYSCVGDRSQSC